MLFNVACGHKEEVLVQGRDTENPDVLEYVR